MVVVLSRLVHRKGTDLLARVIPLVCAAQPQVDFVIGGEGPKARVLRQMVADHGLGGRVELIGPVDTNQVQPLLRRGHIFLNCSLTEAFCIAIVEAACCGLVVVSTNVGGVTEVLPHLGTHRGPEVQPEAPPECNTEAFAVFAEPDAAALADAVRGVEQRQPSQPGTRAQPAGLIENPRRNL